MYLQYLPPKVTPARQHGCWEEYLADEERRFWQTQWRRITLAIIRRWETERACTASNIRRRLKWTRILAERQAAKCSQAGEWCQAPQGGARRPPGVREAATLQWEFSSGSGRG